MEKKSANTNEIKTDLTYDDKVIKKIAGIAAEEVPGLLAITGGIIGNITDRFRSEDKTVGIGVDVGKKQAAIDLNVVCEYGRHIPEVFDMAVVKITDAVLTMTGLDVVEVNMHVEDVLGKEEFSDLKKKLQSSAAAKPKTDSQPESENRSARVE